ncbi:MAG: hypothetical protein H6Q25_448 [Bacteroidetes bacterium]|nr:hypothetical protein [Bacteroidota bacterium]
MLIFVPQITPRIRYTFEIILNGLLGTAYELTDQFDKFDSFSGPKLAYSDQPLENPNHLWIEAIPLLFEENIYNQTITPTPWNEFTLFFPTSQGAFLIDPIAVSFFLISRYEEYSDTFERDQHHRFQAKNSVSYQLGFHRKPIVNILATAIAEKIKEKYPEFTYQKPAYQKLTTYDVDIAYQYRGKGMFRLFGSLAKSLIKFDFITFQKVLKGAYGIAHEDSFDRFDLHKKLASDEQIRPIHFILTAPFSKFDKNIDPHHPEFQKLVHYLQTFSEVGIHPSYHSSENEKLISKEIALLSLKTNFPITKSRQHFLKFRFPDTFEALIEAGIQEDYSLGWHDEAGFRMSITIPVPFFNLKTNLQTHLLLVPLTVMDGALYHLYDSIDMCLNAMHLLQQEVEKQGGVFVVLYHNNSKKHLF